MSERFQIGDMVERFQLLGETHPESPLVDIPLFELHTVSGLGACEDDGEPLLDLKGLEHPDWGYDAEEFRRVLRPDPKLIERLTAEPVFAPPIRKPVKEDA